MLRAGTEHSYWNGKENTATLRRYVGICALLSVVSSVWAAPIAGTSSGEFVNPMGTPSMIISGVGTNAIQWGDPDDFGTGPGRMTFTGNMFAAMPEDQFLLGNLDYFNGSVVQGTSPQGVDLSITVNFTNPSALNATFVFPLTLINTPNQGTPEQQADIVSLPSLFPSTIFMLDGVPHTLKMSFGQSTSGGFTEIDRFFVYESQSASAELRGVLTADVSQVVPEPATWGLLSAGVAFFVWLRPRTGSRRK